MTLLRGWKEIEGYLRLKRKAILRQGFPVRKLDQGASVYAFREELDRHLGGERSKKATKGHKRPKKAIP